ncbi:hypothetical protein H8356DRAFT_1349598 [Neocallimastix lanati (nom. inval.)]|nr:hypothetical protein H8356DRAFT_1349598 [Neocallimastix sp. JGI-2020a]
MQPGEKQLGEMQHFNTTPLVEIQPGEMQFGEIPDSLNMLIPEMYEKDKMNYKCR